VSVPAVLAPVVEPDVSLRQIEAGWDQLIRVTASIERIFPPHFAARRTISEGYLPSCSLM